jgi:RHS repeat-associated protein
VRLSLPTGGFARSRTTPRRRAVVMLAAMVTVTLTANVLADLPAEAVASTWRPSVHKERSVPGTNLAGKSARALGPGSASALRSAPTVAWPAAGVAEVAVPPAATSSATATAATPARAGALPVWVGAPVNTIAPDRVKVSVLDRAAADRSGVAGLVLTVADTKAENTSAGKRVSVVVDYSSFRSAYGVDWASRLRLVTLPGCALSTPERADCRAGRPLVTHNDVKTGRLSADVELGTAAATQVLAATAAPAGNAGDYTATALSASASWHTGSSAGDFTWSYPMDTPPGLGGPEPDLQLAYSSGDVDGRTVSTNNQSSWVGEGWDLATDFIERRYKSCADDVTFTPKPYDLCWETDNAFMSLGGRSVELVRDTATGAWHPRDDDGSRVERLTGATNGDNDGEHWKVTEQDGTQYFFGLNRLPNWAAGNEVTNSVWTVPVFGNDSGEPCHASTFAASYCTQAWRWNLDYVVDPNGNAASYFYDTETNSYGRNRTATADTSYVRAGHLKRIDYGQRANSIYTAPAPMRVSFAVAERCAAGATCGTEDITSTTAKNWPDVPYDQNCKAGAACTDLFAPTFWTRKRLTSVTSSVWVSGTTYKDVNQWTLGYQFRDPGDGTSPSLWLASVTNTGKVGGSAALPAVTFEGTQLENRVDALEGIPAMYKWRLTDVYDESGGHTRVNYSGQECTSTTLPTPDTNTKRCFPQYWVPAGAAGPQLDWFHKYVAVQVLEDDQSGTAGIEETDYEYLDGGAWHYDDNELTPAKYRTWSQWRGFGRVRTTRGAANTVRSQSDSLFFRGMNGDKLSTGTRSASVTDSEGGVVTDHPALAGMQREEITYTGAGGTVLNGTITDPWISAATATRGATSAYLVDVAAERDRTALAAGGWRRTEIQNSYDSYGLPSQVNDLGDTSTAADDQCTRTTYARNTALWLVDLRARVQSSGVACTATPSYPADSISDDLTFYDGSTTLGAAPSIGDITLTQEVGSFSGSTPTYVQVERTVYDAYGRQTEAYDALNRKDTTAYTPSADGPVTAVAQTDALGYTETKTLEPASGQPTSSVDPNGKRTDITYDPLGRVTAEWLPDRSKANGATPNYKYSYLVSATEPVVITTETVRDDGTYEPSYDFFDGRLRPRQTQDPAPDGGRVVTDTFYDSRGLAVTSNGEYWNSGTAGTTLLTGVADNTVPGQTVTVFDGAERPTAEIFLSYGMEKWRSSTAYGGDRVEVTPPAGGTATTTISDADGQTTELRQYTSGTPTGSYDATKYTYGPGGQLAGVTDAAGNTWKYSYDVRGRKISATDPDRGTTTYTYDDGDQVLTSTDARGVTLANSYDALGRHTGLFDGSTSGPKRVEWKYDTLANGTVVKGALASSTRYVGNSAYSLAVSGYDAAYRPLGTTATIPSVEGGLAGIYQVNTGYTATGQPLSLSYPAAGGLAAETLRYGYDASERLTSAQTGLSTMLTGASYTPYDEPSQYTFSAASGKQLTQTFSYEDGTRRLKRAQADRSVAPNHLADLNYSYDASGNVTKIADTPVGGTADTQCFDYDYLARLTQAWTATNDCATAPSVSILGGPAPYWQSWTYDTTGNRRSETNFSTTVPPGARSSGASAGSGAASATGAGTTSTSTYPAAGAIRPHALSTVATNGQSNSFTYDSAGNTTGRTIAGSAQTLTWDAEGHLATATAGGKTSDFVYDADGNRMIRHDTDSTTLYLGATELTLTRSTAAVSATRYYAIGTATAVRTTAGGLSFETVDQQGSPLLSVNATDLSVAQRRYLPFGGLRGAAPASWPTDRGYLNSTVDAITGLTHLGAREYDSATGRFISVDPVVDFEDPQQLNGYAYANNTPVSGNDRDGQLWGWGTIKKAWHKATKIAKHIGRSVKSALKRVVKHVTSWAKQQWKRLQAEAKRRLKSLQAAARRFARKAREAAQRRLAQARRLAAAALRRIHQANRWTGKHLIKLARATGKDFMRGVHRQWSGLRHAAKATGHAATATYHAIGKADRYVLSHEYASVSLCAVACGGVSYQGGTVTVSGSLGGSSLGGVLSNTWKEALKGHIRMFGGASAGWATATADEQAGPTTGLTIADGWGANAGYGDRVGGGSFYFAGPSVGEGWAFQHATGYHTWHLW